MGPVVEIRLLVGYFATVRKRRERVLGAIQAGQRLRPHRTYQLPFVYHASGEDMPTLVEVDALTEQVSHGSIAARGV